MARTKEQDRIRKKLQREKLKALGISPAYYYKQKQIKRLGSIEAVREWERDRKRRYAEKHPNQARDWARRNKEKARMWAKENPEKMKAILKQWYIRKRNNEFQIQLQALKNASEQLKKGIEASC